MKIIKALSHVTVVLATMFLVFFCIDRVNPSMEFISSEISKWVLLLFVLCALSLSILSLVSIRIREVRINKRSAAKLGRTSKVAPEPAAEDAVAAEEVTETAAPTGETEAEEGEENARPVAERAFTADEADAMAEVEALAKRSIAVIGEYGEKAEL